MLKRYFLRFFSLKLWILLVLSSSLLISNQQNFMINKDNIYLGEQLSQIIKVLDQIGKLDEGENSPIKDFNKNFSLDSRHVEYDYIVKLLEYAENILYSNYKKLDMQHGLKLMAELESVVNQVLETRLIVRKTDTFDDVKIKKGLSVTDLYVQNCIKNLCINKLSCTDAMIQNLTVTGTGSTHFNKLSVTDMTVVTLSTNDHVIDETLRFTDTVGGQYVGLKAPSIVSVNYTISLPAITPTSNQTLRTNYATPTSLEWVTPETSADPLETKIIYVAKRGDDNTGNGSLDFPYASLGKAIIIGNQIASATNPISIKIAPGIYIENNNSGPIATTACGLSIIGDSANSVVITPSTPTKDLLLINNTIRISNITFQSTAPLATGICLTAGRLTVFDNVRIINFLVGVNCSGIPIDAYGFISCFFANNGTALVNNNAGIEFNGCTIFGAGSLAAVGENIGITMTGSNARVLFDGGVCGLCSTGFKINDNSFCTINSVAFRRNSYDIIQDGASHLVLSACNFELTNSSTEIDIQVSGVGTTTEIVGCEFNGDATNGIAQAIGIQISDNAIVDINSSSMRNYNTAIVIGASNDTSSTTLTASDVIIKDCTTDILQEGSASLHFTAGILDSNKIIINDTANINLAFFDSAHNGIFSVGSFADHETTLIQAEIGSANHPKINYNPSLYSSHAMGFENPLATGTTWFVTSSEESNMSVITTDRTKSANIQLLSDEGSFIGGTTALRGWSIDKKGSSAQLSFDYQNTDIVDQVTVANYTVMQLDGINNQLQLPHERTQIVFAQDTNLYRSDANVLKTDNNMIIGGLMPGYAVATDPISNQLVSTFVTNAELACVAGVTSPIQEQLNAINDAIVMLQQMISSGR